LVGWSGFVGGLLSDASPFDAKFRSVDVEELTHGEWDEVVYAGTPAEKWRANQDPQRDVEALERIWDVLRRTSARRVVLISTVDVYHPPVGCTEADAPTATHAYGANRAELERRVLEQFDDVSVVRLPALYGPGLKKNALYDLLQGEACPAPRPARFQWYDLEGLPADLDRIRRDGLRLVQLVTEPVAMGEIVDACFPGADTAEDRPVIAYDLRTMHDGPYVASHDEALAGVVRFVERVRSGEVACASRSA
jgi:hypothetical protein